MNKYPKNRERNFINTSIGIPINDDEICQCIVLWESSRYKDVVLLGITSSVTREGEALTDPLSFKSMIYTASTPIRQGRWKFIAEVNMVIPEDISRRNIAGAVWVGDRELHQCSEQDWDDLPQMDVCGAALVEKYVKYLSGRGEETPFATKTNDIMGSLLRNNNLA